MDWNNLKTFLAIARAGTLAGAARQLGVNHSTVFRRLNSFEDDLGSHLFKRLNEGYQLTNAGEKLLLEAERISNTFDSLEREFMGQDFKPAGNVRLTAPANIAYRYLPLYLSAFSKLYPEIAIELIISNQDFSLTRREADIAIRATPRPPEHLIGRKVWDIGWSAYVGDGYSVNKEMPLTTAELGQHRLIGGEGAMSSLPAFQWLNNQMSDQQVARCNDLVAMAALAAAGYGIALLPDDQARDGLNRLFEFKPGKQSHLWLLTHPDLRKVERIKLLMNYLFECFGSDSRVINSQIVQEHP